MADKKISQLTGASTPLAGTEVLPIVQSGSTVKVSAADVTSGRAVSALTYTSTATTGTAPFTVSSTTQVANLNSATAGTAENLKSNATTGVMQIAGPAAASTRVMTIPDANFTVARTDAGQTFTGTQTVLAAATQDAVALAGRAGGTGSYVSTVTPTTLSANRTVTLPNADTNVPVASQTLTFSGPSAARTVTLPDANFTAARTDAAQTLTGNQTISSGNLVVGTAANGISFTSGGFIASSQGQFTVGGGTTTTFVTLPNVNENRTYMVSVRQSGNGVNFVLGFAMSYGTGAIIKRIVQDNTNPVVDMDLTNTGLDLKLVLGAGFGTTTWDYIITRLS